MGQFFQGGDNLRAMGAFGARGAAHDDDHVVIIAEFADVLFPALVVFAVLADEVVAVDFVGEMDAHVPQGQGAGGHGNQQHGPGIAKANAGQARQQAGHQGGLGLVFGAHRFPLPPCSGNGERRILGDAA